jgi:hypothetical protein
MRRDSPLRTRAFGMDLDAGFDMPGLGSSPRAGEGRALSLTLCRPEDVDVETVERIAELRFDDGRLAVAIDSAGPHGYLCYAFDFGRALIAPDGRRALIAPVDEPDWVWQRYLTGQLLPFAAVLQGLEVFHACVLGHEGGAFAVVARGGVGKTSLALRLALQGLEFLSDDVLVLEPTDGAVLAHPGVGLANVRPGAGELLDRLERAGLAAPIGTSEHETRISIRRYEDPLPMRALFVYNRFAEQPEVEVERLSPVDPRLLLASTFNLSVRTPERLTRQLDVCAAIERSAAVFRVSCGGDVTADQVAAVIAERAAELTATSP